MATHTVCDLEGSILVRVVFPPPSPSMQRGEVYDGAGSHIGYVLTDHLYATTDYFADNRGSIGKFQPVSGTRTKQSSAYYFGKQQGYLEIREGEQVYWATDWSAVASGVEELEFIGTTVSDWTDEDSAPLLDNIPQDQFGFTRNMIEGGQRLVVGMAVFAFELLE